ncbi:hypothetical protein [Arhodomonas sp. AD133]|uniref:hypothetical protein n=1 Tax=Arhodomonas sp. AD133 TaxID=3415009 RepID=UPI003EB918F8
MAMGILRENGALYSYEIGLEKALYDWFKSNLAVPPTLAGSQGHSRKPAAISWFKESAIEHIDKMRQYAQLLASHDFLVQQLVTERPGKVVYEDEHQVAAVPFKDTFRASHK